VPCDGRTPSYLLLQVFVRSHDRLENHASACWSMSNLSVPGGWTCVITPRRVTPPLLASVVVANAVGGLIGRFAEHKESTGLQDGLDKLRPGHRGDRGDDR
jgi:hypothetical protein